MEIKDIIKSRRMELGYSMRDIAQRVGVSEATVSRWESGDIANMKRDKIKKLADALLISPGVIMGWEPTRDQNPDYIYLDAFIKAAYGIVVASIHFYQIQDLIFVKHSDIYKCTLP